MIRPADVLQRTTLLVRDHLEIGSMEGDVPNAFSDATVGVVVNPAMLEHHGFVAALECLRVLLAGMCVGMRLEVRGPDRGVVLKPPFSQKHWLDALAEYRQDACAPFSVGTLDSGCITRVGLGVSDDRLDYLMAADESSFWLASSPGPAAWHLASIWSGAGSAVLAAAEVYKRILSEFSSDLRIHSDFAPVRDFVVTLNGSTSTYLPGSVAVISAGAITNAAIFLLARCGGAIELSVWDDDTLKVDNLNRYPLFDVQHLDALKVDALASLELPLLTVKPYPRRFDSEELSSIPTVLVGADRIMPRWEVARRRPRTSVIGSTDHYLTLDSIHVAGNGGCAACLHQHDDGVDAVVPTVSFVSFAAGLEAAMFLAESQKGKSRYRLTRTWLRPDVEMSLLSGAVPYSPHCPLGCGAMTNGGDA
jgi:hypothetical protein